MKIAFDQQTDYSGKEIFNMLSGVNIPEYVKTAEVEDLHELRDLPKTAFADPNRGIYPINTPARVYVSNAHFINKQAAIAKLYGKEYASQLESAIKQAADIFGISEDLEEYGSSFNEKQASDYAQRYMLNWSPAPDSSFELYPVKTASDLSEAAEHFTKNISNFPFEVRVSTAGNFLKAAQELGVDELPDLLAKYAGLFYPDLSSLQSELWRRSTKLASDEHKEIYNKIAEDLHNMTSVEEVMKIAETCYNIESMEGLYDKTKVAQLLGDPVDCIFTEQIVKIASDLSYVEVHGDKYKLDDLVKISKERYEEAFGDSGIDPADPEKIAEILPTMPRSDVKLLEELTGLRPI
jgi:hypothetical protein